MAAGYWNQPVYVGPATVINQILYDTVGSGVGPFITTFMVRDTTGDLMEVNADGSLNVAVTAALPAGTNAIGKLAANAGVTIGAVEIAAAQTLATVTTVGTVSAVTTVSTVTAVTAISNALPAGTNTIGGVTVVPAGTWTDRSATVTLGGTSQQLAATNSVRRYLLIQNISSTDLWINFGTAAVADSPSVLIRAASTDGAGDGGVLVFESAFVPTAACNIIGATTGKKFVAKEG